MKPVPPHVNESGKSHGLDHTRRNGHLPDLLELAMATHTRDTVKAVQEAISRATLQLGDTELRPRQDLAIRRFLRWKDIFVCFPTISGKLLAWVTASSICLTTFSQSVSLSSRLSMDDKRENGTAKPQLLRPYRVARRQLISVEGEHAG